MQINYTSKQLLFSYEQNKVENGCSVCSLFLHKYLHNCGRKLSVHLVTSFDVVTYVGTCALNRVKRVVQAQGQRGLVEMSGSSSGEPFQLEAWCQRELAKLLAFPVEEDLVRFITRTKALHLCNRPPPPHQPHNSYLVSMETERDVEDYLEELLGKETRGVKPFMREFLRRWGRGSVVREEGGREVLQELVRPNQDELLLFAEKKTDSALPQKVCMYVFVCVCNYYFSFLGQPPPGFEAASKGANPPPLGVTTNYSKRSKYIPLMSSEGQSRATVQLPGRHGCQCLAQKHALVNNCVECGRIVCSQVSVCVCVCVCYPTLPLQEGSGPCLTCGALVCSPEEEELLARQSKKGLKFREKFLKKFQIKVLKRLTIVHGFRPESENVDFGKQ